MTYMTRAVWMSNQAIRVDEGPISPGKHDVADSQRSRPPLLVERSGDDVQLALAVSTQCWKPLRLDGAFCNDTDVQPWFSGAKGAT